MPAPRVVRLTHAEIALTVTDKLPLSATSLAAATVSELERINQSVFWEVTGRYDPATETVTLQVVDFIPLYERFQTFSQVPLTSPVRFVRFEPFSEAGYAAWQARYQPAGNRPRPLADGGDMLGFAGTRAEADAHYGPIFQPPPPRPTTWTANFKYRFADAEFANGELRGQWNKPPKGHQPVPFCIENLHLQAEFGYICDYLTRKLGNQHFDVALSVREHPDGTRDVTATSQLVAQIDSLLVEKWRTERAAVARKRAAKMDTYSPAPTLAEVAAQLRDPNEPAGLLTPEQLQALWIDMAEGRNRQQLQYLASEKHDLAMPVRYTFGKYEGFIFLVTGRQERHFCWELLNSNATYVWSFPLALTEADTVALLEKQLRTLNQVGREEYRKQHGDAADAGRFRRLKHTIQGLTPDQTFQQWRGELAGLIS